MTKPLNRRNTITPKLERNRLHATDQELAKFEPQEIHRAIATALVNSTGISIESLHEELKPYKFSKEAIRQAIDHPVSAAWISNQLDGIITQRLPMVLAVLFGRSLAGDVNAAKLVLTRYGALIERQLNVNITDEFAHMSDADLETIIKGETTCQSSKPSEPASSSPAPLSPPSPSPTTPSSSPSSTTNTSSTKSSSSAKPPSKPS